MPNTVWPGGERFELVIIDDGSTDDTTEIAQDLAARFPQIRLLRHPVRLGLGETIQTGLDQAKVQVILIGNDAYLFDVDDLRTLWQLRDAQRELTRRTDASPAKAFAADEAREPSSSLTRLAHQLGFQPIRPEAFEQLRLSRALDTIARIDAAGHAAALAVPERPSRLVRHNRLTRE
jgi:glycosyltransferase involved in cell wall biosynthesis